MVPDFLPLTSDLPVTMHKTVCVSYFARPLRMPSLFPMPDTEPAPPPTRPRRRPWRISVAGMMILVLLIGIPLGWKARRASLQRRAVARINALQGTVVYDWHRAKLGQTEPPGPAWLRNRLGDEYFQEIDEIRLPLMSVKLMYLQQTRQAKEKQINVGSVSQESLEKTVVEPLARDQLACLEDCDQLRSLTLTQEFPLKPESWDRLAGLPHLKGLWIEYPLKVNMGENLARLTSLESLNITVDHNRVDKTNSPNLDFLARLPHLKTLSISSNDFTQQNLTIISQIQNLEDLTIGDTYSTSDEKFSPDPDFFAPLGQLPRLKSLEFISRRNSGNLTRYLARIHSLESIHIWSFTKLDNQSLTRLKTLPNLRNLRADVTNVDPRVMEEFNRDRPDISIKPPSF